MGIANQQLGEVLQTIKNAFFTPVGLRACDYEAICGIEMLLRG